MAETYNQEEVAELFDVVFKLSAKDVDDKLKKVSNRPDIAKRRWFWELLQNAKDSVKSNERVSVKLILGKENDQPFISFQHNGNPFRYQDAKNLIFPYSDKGDEENSDKSGRFGTGFLATHILSKEIKVTGIFSKENKFFNIDFTLNRAGNDKPQIAEDIRRTWNEFRVNGTEIQNFTYNQNNYDTCFQYALAPDSLKIAIDSLAEINTSLPYILTFIPKIKSVEIVNSIDNYTHRFCLKSESTIDDKTHIKKHLIEKQINNGQSLETTTFTIITASHEEVNIAIEVSESDGITYISEFPSNQPLTFCPFPLIGAKDLQFPTIVNCLQFIPKEERDGIWLDNTEYGFTNQKFFEKTIVPYFNLLSFAGEKNWKNRHILIRTLNENVSLPDFNEKWFKDIIQGVLKKLVIDTPLMVEVPNGDRLKISAIHFQNEIKEKNRKALWNFNKAFHPNEIPLEEEIDQWYSVLWKECPNYTIESFTKFVSSFNSVESLKARLSKSREDTITWLNPFVTFIVEDNSSLLNKVDSKILPNQFGVFMIKDELHLDDGTIDDDLKEILSDISKVSKKTHDWRNDMLEKKIFLELPANRTRTIQMIGTTISDITKELLKEDSPSNELKSIFSKLLIWMSEYPGKAKDHFKSLKTETLLYKTASERKIKQLADILQKDRDGEILVEDLVNISASKIALLKDPNLELKVRLGEQVLEDQEIEKQELLFKKKTGDVFETLFKELIKSDSRFSIKKVEGEEDFVITNTVTNSEFYIELKSIKSKESAVQVTHKQAKKAYRFPNNYFLCIIPNDGSTIDRSYFLTHATFDSNIGDKLVRKIEAAISFEKPENGITVLFEDELLKSYSKYRYKFSIDRTIWGTDKFESFKTKLG